MATRRMIDHFYGGGIDAIDGWRCSNCRWSYDLDNPVGKYDVPDDIHQRAKEEFDRHLCPERA
jgi:hypothetical protein